jgi:hypothetical protein
VEIRSRNGNGTDYSAGDILDHSSVRYEALGQWKLEADRRVNLIRNIGTRASSSTNTLLRSFVLVARRRGQKDELACCMVDDVL